MRSRLWRGSLPKSGMSAVPSKTAIGEEATLFHDYALSELTFRQIRNTREEDLAPFALRMDVFAFDGSFLSLVIDASQAVCDGLQRRHIVRVNTVIETEKPL